MSKQDLDKVFQVLLKLDSWNGAESDTPDEQEVLPEIAGFTEALTLGELREAMFIIDQLKAGTR